MRVEIVIRILICSSLLHLRRTGRGCLCFRVRGGSGGARCGRARATLPHVSDDEVGWGNEEVIDPLKSCADSVMYFSHTCLRNDLWTTDRTELL